MSDTNKFITGVLVGFLAGITSSIGTYYGIKELDKRGKLVMVKKVIRKIKKKKK